MQEQIIKDRLEKLPEDLKRGVLHYIDSLLQKHNDNKKNHGFRFDWEGGLSNHGQKHTSVELQHKSMEWR